MPANHDVGNTAGRTPASPSSDEVTLVRELTEAFTALGNYLAAARHEFENQPGPMPEALGEALRKSLGQHARAAECIRRLRKLFLLEGESNGDRSDIDQGPQGPGARS